MAEKQVIIVVHADGRVELEAKFFQGHDCEKVIKDFEQALGHKTAEQKKPEWHQQTTTHAKQGR